METLRLINENRIKHGYIHRDYERYKRFCNRKYNELKGTDGALCIVYHIESNLAKSRKFGSLRYLHKVERLLRKSSEDFAAVYSKYIQCFIGAKKNVLDMDMLVELRSTMADYYSFVDDIYTMGEDRHNFDAYRVKHQWHDILLYFETQKMLDDFIAGEFFLEDCRFNTQLVYRVARAERAQRKLLKSVDEQTESTLAMLSRSKTLQERANELYNFIQNNFIDSQYVRTLKESAEGVHSFITNLAAYSNGLVSSDIEGFEVPEIFKEYSAAFDRLRESKSVDPRKLRELLIRTLEERVTGNLEKRPMPLLPEFYDLAFDFIKYPSVDPNIISTLRQFSLFR